LVLSFLAAGLVQLV